MAKDRKTGPEHTPTLDRANVLGFFALASLTHVELDVLTFV
jgi:hypothetical protein